MSIHTGEPVPFSGAHFLRGLDAANSIHGPGIEGVRHRFAHLARLCIAIGGTGNLSAPELLGAVAAQLGEAYHVASLQHAEEIHKEVTIRPAAPLLAVQNQHTA